MVNYLDQKLDPKVRDRIAAEISEHTEILRRQLESSVEHARRYLTLVNGGSAVALLAFMGQNPDLRRATFALSALALYAIGVTAVGVLAAIDYHLRVCIFEGWINDSGKVFRGELDHMDLYKNSELRDERWKFLAPACGYIAFGCFIFGSTIAIAGFLCWT